MDARAAGSLFSAHLHLSSHMPSWHPYEKYNEFYAGSRALGGGAVLSEIHELDLVYRMFGLPRRVWSVGGTLSSYDLDVEDTVSSLLEFHVDGSVLPVTVNMSFVQRPNRRTITVMAEEGRIHWDMMQGELRVEDTEGTVRERFVAEGFERNDMFIAEMRHFISCVETGAEPETSLQRVVGGHRMALAMKDSLYTGKIITWALENTK